MHGFAPCDPGLRDVTSCHVALSGRVVASCAGSGAACTGGYRVGGSRGITQPCGAGQSSLLARCVVLCARTLPTTYNSLQRCGSYIHTYGVCLKSTGPPGLTLRLASRTGPCTPGLTYGASSYCNHRSAGSEPAACTSTQARRGLAHTTVRPAQKIPPGGSVVQGLFNPAGRTNTLKHTHKQPASYHCCIAKLFSFLVDPRCLVEASPLAVWGCNAGSPGSGKQPQALAGSKAG
ncbi:hypothetical protein Bbelb_203260 [Branchiostoma belcheri]|nr:hypothetical protein Bbelb_203260 [Branchiostoma belcheri]